MMTDDQVIELHKQLTKWKNGEITRDELRNWFDTFSENLTDEGREFSLIEVGRYIMGEYD